MSGKRVSPQKLVPVSEQMQAWTSALAAELQDWPQITLKSFFGFTALYRDKNMFGLLPRTRSIFTGNAIAFRLEKSSRQTQAFLKKDPRISAFDKDKARWYTFQLSSDADLHDALDYLAQAFEASGMNKKK